MEKKTIKKRKIIRNFNLDEKIYCLCTIRPRCKTNINTILQQSNKSSYAYLSGESGIFKQLIKRKWLKKDREYVDPSLIIERDKRSLTRVYYRANPLPVIKRINERILLDDLDEYVIKDKLNTKFFKDSLEKINSSSLDEAQGIEQIIFTLDLLFFTIEKIGWPNWKINTEKQYEKAKKSLNNEIRSLLKNPKLLNQIISKSKVSNDLAIDFLNFSVIPESTLLKLKGINSYVQRWREFDILTKAMNEIIIKK